jgi:hypothetical protein
MELVIGQQSQLFQQINSLKLLQRVVTLDGLSSECLLSGDISRRFGFLWIYLVFESYILEIKFDRALVGVFISET